MVTFILPGYSPQNKIWAEDTANKLNLNQEMRPVFWNHWGDPSKEFDPQEKVRLIIDVARQNSINIIAKSIGSLVASYIIQEVPERMQKVIFCGIPLNDINEEQKEVIRKALEGFPEDKITVFQNIDDPHGTYDQVSDFLAKVNSKINIISKNRSDHEYPYYKEFREFLVI